jgi:NADH dehydrogenase FAD-containing subunit
VAAREARGGALVVGGGFAGTYVARLLCKRGATIVSPENHPYQLPLLSRKLRVVVDWTVSLFFRPDIAELEMLGHPQRLGDA